MARASTKGRSRKKSASKSSKGKTKSKSPNVPARFNDSSSRSALNAPAQIDSSDTATGPTFYLFPKLPIEIRLRIWKLVGPKPGILEQAKALGYKPLYTIMHPRPTPAVLHVCQESRKEFLYREDEAANDGNSHALYRQAFPSTNGLMCHFSFEVDTLYMTSVCKVRFGGGWPRGWNSILFKTRLDLAEKDVIRELRFLAIDRRELEHLEAVFFKSLARFQKLEELILLSRDVSTNFNLVYPVQQSIISKIEEAKSRGLVKEGLVLKFRDQGEFEEDPRA